MSTQEPTETKPNEEEPSRSPEQILATPPATGDLTAALDRPRRRRGLPSSTGVLATVVLLAAGFFGGLLVGRATAPTEQAGFAAGAPGAFPSPGAATGDGRTFGTVVSVKGDTLTLETADGSTVKVVTDADTQIRVSVDGTLADLAEGSTVIVQGASGDDGTVEATSIVEGDLAPAAPAGSGG